MPEYVRPAVTARKFRDEFGAVIPYGRRWAGSPPDDAYSRVSNLERFAPLQTVADALIEHLRATFRADVAPLATPFTTPATTKLVAVTPDRADAAPLMIRFTDFPGVVLRAGLRCSPAFPACGCDACDEAWEEAADEMERLVFAVTDGRFSERIDLASGGKATVEHRIETFGGPRRSGFAHGVEPDPGLRDDAARLYGLPAGRWQPWPRRSKT